MHTAIDVRILRERLGWTQQQLAEHCGVDRSTISKWESETPNKGPALILLRQLAAMPVTPVDGAEAPPSVLPDGASHGSRPSCGPPSNGEITQIFEAAE